MSHASAHVEVQSCMRVDADGGDDDAGADAAGQQQVTVDVSPTGAVCNGQTGCTCYSPEL